MRQWVNISWENARMKLNGELCILFKVNFRSRKMLEQGQWNGSVGKGTFQNRFLQVVLWPLHSCVCPFPPSPHPHTPILFFNVRTLLNQKRLGCYFRMGLSDFVKVIYLISVGAALSLRLFDSKHAHSFITYLFRIVLLSLKKQNKTKLFP